MERYRGAGVETCPKCGGTAMTLEWRGPLDAIARPLDAVAGVEAGKIAREAKPERLRVECSQCHHYWFRKPLDAPITDEERAAAEVTHGMCECYACLDLARRQPAVVPATNGDP